VRSQSWPHRDLYLSLRELSPRLTCTPARSLWMIPLTKKATKSHSILSASRSATNLHQGDRVMVTAEFDGTRYLATAITSN
jgi:hypothetical protein